MATLEDIARRLGTTKGTVSKALNGASDVSEAMRKAVVEAAVELGYNRINRTGARKRIALFIENMAYEQVNDFGYDIVFGFRKAAEPAGFTVDIVPLSVNLEKEYPYDEYMLLHRYHGGIFLGLSLNDPWIQDFKTCRTPTVLYDNCVRGNPHVTSLGINSDEAMDLAVSHLKKLGHRKIGYLSGALGSYVYQARYKSFFRALRQNGLDDSYSLAGNSFYTSECLEKHLPRLLELGCTAIICCNDLLAHTVMIHLHEHGRKIPHDISIIGVDDLPLCQFTIPPLTTIRQNREGLGKSAFYALYTQLNQVPISGIYLHPELILRDSTGPCPQTTEYKSFVSLDCSFGQS